jgi:hypothetical protein
MAEVVRNHSKKLLAITLLLGMGFFWFSLVDTSHGAQVTSRSDTLDNSNVSVTSNHAMAFTVQDNLVSQSCSTPPCAGTTSSTLSITLASQFNLNTLTCGDVNLATGTPVLFNVASPETRTSCLNTGTSWGVLIDSVNNVITFTTPTSASQYVWVATSTQLTISIGSNATNQNQGTHWIVNPSSGGTYTETVGGTFGGSGNMLVSINQASQLSATVAETLTFNINGLPITPASGSDKMSACDINYLGGGIGTDDEDSRALNNIVTTTAAAVPFGTIVPNNGLSQGCQRLDIQTNAGSGYTITTRENNPLETLGGFIIDDTRCSTGTCTPTTAASYTGANTGLAISCVNSSTSASCSTSNPNWNNGSNWAPISAESKNLSPAKFSGVSSATSALVLVKAKFRLGTIRNTPAGVYSNLVSFIATPVF